MTTRELNRWIGKRRDFVLLDVLPRGEFDSAHLPGAQSACVYEVTFLDQVKVIVARYDQPVVVYGAGAATRESAEAARKLREAGYRTVHEYRGGLAEWKRAGGLVEGTGRSVVTPSLKNRAYRVDAARSVIEWTGRNLAGGHCGTMRLSTGEIKVRQGQLAGGQFTIDMRSIVNEDLADKAYAQVLVRHLMSEDFFDVVRHPRGKFVITRVTPIRGAVPGSPNCTIHGTLTLRKIARPLRFPAVTGATAQGELVAQACLDFDRTLWNALYGSGRFFAKLGRHLVNDLVSVRLKIVAT